MTQNVINKICFAFNNFSSLKNKRKQNYAAILTKVFRSYVKDNYNYAAEFELCTQTPSNA